MATLTPIPTAAIGKSKAKHLLKRASYNVTKARIDEFSSLKIDQALDELIKPYEPNTRQPLTLEGNAMVEPDAEYGALNPTVEEFSSSSVFTSVVNATRAWWLDNAIKDPTIRSRMSYFLFSFVPALTDKRFRGGDYDYWRLLSHYCLGNFQDFIYQVTINSAMLTYLNNDLNKKGAPNENYAREVLELFTIGKGPLVAEGDFSNYTEDDIVEAARLLTGWKNHPLRTRTNNNSNGELEPNNGNIPVGTANPSDHDFGEKVFSYRFQNRVIAAYDTVGKTDEELKARMKEELREFFAMIFDQDETARYVCRRMYRYFVFREITDEIEQNIIEPLATIFRTNYNLGDTISALLKSEHFFEVENMGGMIKSPLELSLQTLSVLEFPIPENKPGARFVPYYVNDMGKVVFAPSSQPPFAPSSVAGFPPIYEAPEYDKFWFNSTTLIPRYGIKDFFLGSRTRFNSTIFIQNTISNPSDANVLITELVDLLFALPVPQERLDYFLGVHLLDDNSITQEMWAFEWRAYIDTGDKSGVEVAIRELLRALISSQEFQLN